MSHREHSPPPTISRKVPPSDPPLLTWRVPVGGVFQDQGEGDPFTESMFSRELEAGVVWRTTTKTDREIMSIFYDFYTESHAVVDADAMIWADTLLASEEPGVELAPGLSPDAFVNALSLHTEAPLRIQVLRFEVEISDEERILPHLGHRLFRTVHLPSWGTQGFQQPIGMTTIDAVRNTYPNIKRLLEQSEENGLRRSLGAYRAGVAEAAYIHAIPVLLCASLEAIAVSYKESAVIQRLARYAPEASGTLESLYKVRHWFAHGAPIPEMKDPIARIQTIGKGLAAVKEILIAAYADDELFEAAKQSGSSVTKFLDEQRLCR
jgi:hypothetical protein